MFIVGSLGRQSSIGVANVEKRSEVFKIEQTGNRGMGNLSSYSMFILEIQISALFWLSPYFLRF